MSFHVPLLSLLDPADPGSDGTIINPPGGGDDPNAYVLTVGTGPTFYQIPTQPYLDYGYFGFRTGAPTQIDAGALVPDTLDSRVIDSIYLSPPLEAGIPTAPVNSIRLGLDNGEIAVGALSIWHAGVTYLLTAQGGASSFYRTTAEIQGDLKNSAYWTANGSLTIYINETPEPDAVGGFDANFDQNWNA